MITTEQMLAIPAVETSCLESLDAQPVVSVLMLAYNHEKYIDQAIESIVTQQCDFPFELIIGDDASTDHTHERCVMWQTKYPQRIRIIGGSQNVGMHQNYARLWCRARGPYITHCEGDDFWCDSRKLARQVAHMNAHPEYSMSGTLTRKIELNATGQWVDAGMVRPGSTQESYGMEEILDAYNFHFSSVIIRKQSVEFPDWFWQVYAVDRPLYVLCAEKGRVGFIPEVTSVYRLHGAGAWAFSKAMEKAQNSIHLFKLLDRHLEFRYSALIRKSLANIIWSYMGEAMLRGDAKSARSLFWKSISISFPKPNVPITHMCKVMTRLYLFPKP